MTQTRGAGPITVQRFKAGKLISEKVIPAPTLESVRDPVTKRGPKPGFKGKTAERYAVFAGSENWY